MGQAERQGQPIVLRQPGGSWSPAEPCVVTFLERAAIVRVELLPSGSNYVFSALLEDDEGGRSAAIYKPRRGEAPLHDFPDGTLYRRERAAYVVSRALGWRLIPPTVVRDGPHGPGAVQLFIEHRPRSSYFTMKGRRERELQRMALFDAAVNNADRKGGHCLEALDGHIWGIDHGLTFHSQNKLRTVIWDYAGAEIPNDLLDELRPLAGWVTERAHGLAELDELLHPTEVRALVARIERLCREGSYPLPPPWRPVPWPPL